ncbi:MAG: leucine-rich repeat protein [Treponema sp.]|nr:leucine-rich repeat protein [Treponema sp.]
MDIQEFLKRGYDYCEKNDFDGAIAEFEEVLKIDPNHLEAKNSLSGSYFNRGIAYNKEGDNTKAIEYLTKALDHKRDDAQIYGARGVFYNEVGDFNNVIDDFTEVINLSPTSAAYSFRSGALDNKSKEYLKDDFINFLIYRDLAIEDMKLSLEYYRKENGCDDENKKKILELMISERGRRIKLHNYINGTTSNEVEEEKRKKDEERKLKERERKEREERERKAREEKERKEREHQEWLASEEGQKWQAEKEKKEQQRRAEEQKRLKNEKSRKIRKKIVVICAVASVIILIAFGVYRSTGSFFKFMINENGTLTVTGYSGRKDVVIPSANNGINVTEIGSSAFSGKNLKSVVIPDGINSIGDSAFYGNQLTNVTIPNSVTIIGGHAFANNRLSSVIIPDGVTIIGDYAFSHPGGTGTRLTSIVISNTVTSIGSRAFQYNTPISITIGANVLLDDSFNYNFDNIYNNGGKLAGTYSRSGVVNDRNWTRR